MSEATLAKKQSNTAIQRIYGAVGFKTGVNFILWFIFAGALFAFALSRTIYFNFATLCAASPTKCFHYSTVYFEKVGIYLHLVGTLFAAMMAVLQFTPIIRYKSIRFHRINGYATLLLFTLGTAGAFMIARYAFAGGLDTQAWVGVVGIACMVSFALAWWEIKQLRIDRHRAWMLRGWAYAACIITARFIIFSGAFIISNLNAYNIAYSCAKIAFTYDNTPARYLGIYPECASYVNGTNPAQEAVVHASMYNGRPSEIGAALDMTFGMALWISLSLHAACVEVYLNLTRSETERLKMISYQRRFAAGKKVPNSVQFAADHPGEAGPNVQSCQRASSTSQLFYNEASQAQPAGLKL